MCVKTFAHALCPIYQSTTGLVGASLAGRFFSSVLNEAYLWHCVRYVERNPVRAGMIEKAEGRPKKG